MLSENQRIRGLISSVIDIVLLIAAYLLANFLRFNWLPFFEEGGAGPALDIARSPMVALGWAGYAVVMVLLYWSRGLYNPSRLRGLWQRSTTIAFGNALGVVGFMALLFVFRLTVDLEISRFLKRLSASGFRFYPAMIWAVSNVLNAHAEFRYGWDDQGRLVLWDRIEPYYAHFHPERETFAKLVTPFSSDLETFHRRFLEDRTRYAALDHFDLTDVPPNTFDV